MVCEKVHVWGEGMVCTCVALCVGHVGVYGVYVYE